MNEDVKSFLVSFAFSGPLAFVALRLFMLYVPKPGF